MKVTVDLGKCEDHGQCVFAAPGLFDFDDEDKLVWRENPEEADRAAVDAAVSACPVAAIRVED